MAGRPGGVPAMTLQYVVENVGGLSLDKLNFDTSVDFALMIPTFESDTKYDYCTMFEPSASEFVAAGKGHIVASVGEASGSVPYTSFSASKNYLKNNRALCEDFLRAIKKGYEFMLTATEAEIADALAHSFTGVSKESIKASIRSYLAIDAWSHDMVFSADSFNKLQDIMENAGYLTSRASYSLAVDNSIALGLKA